MANIRRQLTLFVRQTDAEQIEKIRQKFNPIQSELIDCHVTLCRDDEIENIDKVLNNLTQLRQKSISIIFGQVTRFENGKGVFIPATIENEEFQELRQKVLNGVVNKPKRHEPHITLMHPRNSSCTDSIFEEIEKENLPSKLNFKTISLIEQINGGQWTILKTIDLVD